MESLSVRPKSPPQKEKKKRTRSNGTDHCMYRCLPFLPVAALSLGCSFLQPFEQCVNVMHSGGADWPGPACGLCASWFFIGGTHCKLKNWCQKPPKVNKGPNPRPLFMSLRPTLSPWVCCRITSFPPDLYRGHLCLCGSAKFFD